MRTKPRQAPNEYELVCDSYSRIIKEGDSLACMEAPTLGRAIDLVLYRGRSLTSIEFKLKDWKRALKQARDHRLVADYAYVCMPSKSLTSEIEKGFKDAGVGLFFYVSKGKCPFKEVIPAPKSSEVWNAARKRLIAYIKAQPRTESNERTS